MSQEDVNVNFASLPCYYSNLRLEENLTKSNCREFQHSAPKKASETQLCQKFQLDSLKLFFYLKFVDFVLDKTLSKLHFVKSSNSEFNLGFPKLNFPKVIRLPKLSKVSAQNLKTVFFKLYFIRSSNLELEVSLYQTVLMLNLVEN